MEGNGNSWEGRRHACFCHWHSKHTFFFFGNYWQAHGQSQRKFTCRGGANFPGKPQKSSRESGTKSLYLDGKCNKSSLCEDPWCFSPLSLPNPSLYHHYFFVIPFPQARVSSAQPNEQWLSSELKDSMRISSNESYMIFRPMTHKKPPYGRRNCVHLYPSIQLDFNLKVNH